MEVATMLSQQTHEPQLLYQHTVDRTPDSTIVSNVQQSPQHTFEHHSPAHTTSNPHQSPRHSESIHGSNGCNSNIPKQVPSSIPRLAPSGIPRLSSLIPKPQPINTNNNANSVRNGLCSNPVQREQKESHTTPNTPSCPYPSSVCSPDPSIPESTRSSIDRYEAVEIRNHVSRSRAPMRVTGQQERAFSEHPRGAPDTESETSSVFSSSGPPKVITSKIGSMANIKHKPGGGNVRIHDEKVQIGPIKGKCNSFANVKHKPGGGDVRIVDEKVDFSNTANSKIKSLQNVKHTPGGGDKQVVKYAIIPIITQNVDFSQKATSKVSSFANVKHKPAGGDVKIFSEKPEFSKTAQSKIGSLKNIQHRPSGGDVQIFNEQLPWLKYNKPNLSAEEKAKINKRSTSHSDMNTSFTSSSTGR